MFKKSLFIILSAVFLFVMFSLTGCSLKDNHSSVAEIVESPDQQISSESTLPDKSIKKMKNTAFTSKTFKIIGNGMSFDVPLWEKKVDKEFSTVFCSETNEFLAIVRVPIDFNNSLEYLYTFTNNQFITDVSDVLNIEDVSTITGKFTKTENNGIDIYKTTGETISYSGERIGYVVSYTFVYKKLPITVFCGDTNGETSKSDTNNINKIIKSVVDSIQDIS